MSVKIYNGCVLNTTNIMEIQKTIVDFRDQLNKKVYDKTVQYYVDECTSLFDANTLNNDKNKAIFSTIHQQFMMKQDEVRVKGVSDPSVDFQFSVVILPTASKFYGMFYTEQPEFADMWAELDMVDEYFYYNNSDQPDNISEEEWKERGEVWDKLLSIGDDVPSLAGFTFSVVQEHTHALPKIKDVINGIPPINKRAELKAKDIVFRRFCKSKTITSNSVMKIYKEFLEFLDTDAGAKKFDDEIGRIIAKLKMNITELELTQ